MPRIVKLLLALSLAAVLGGCVVAPLGPPRPYAAAARLSANSNLTMPGMLPLLIRLT